MKHNAKHSSLSSQLLCTIHDSPALIWYQVQLTYFYSTTSVVVTKTKPYCDWAEVDNSRCTTWDTTGNCAVCFCQNGNSGSQPSLWAIGAIHLNRPNLNVSNKPTSNSKPKPTHEKAKLQFPDPTQLNPWMDPTDGSNTDCMNGKIKKDKEMSAFIAAVIVVEC